MGAAAGISTKSLPENLLLQPAAFFKVKPTGCSNQSLLFVESRQHFSAIIFIHNQVAARCQPACINSGL